MDTNSSISDSDVYSPSSPHSTPRMRPNRWVGPPSTWHSLTEQERGLAASLDQIRNQDLSIHLYNAHALKRRARRFERWKSEGKEFDEEGEGMGWVPPRKWAAWPLTPDLVPREGEVIGEDDGEDIFTLRRNDKEALSAELEGQLIAVTLRFAKERFERRKSAGSEGSTDEVDYFGVRTKTHMNEIYHVSEDIETIGNDSLDEVKGDSEGDQDSFESTANEFLELPQTYMKPVVSTDDERSADILRPSIRHTLSKLDGVLMALHHARETCHQYAARSAANTDDETVHDKKSGTQSNTPAKRARGRPRKLENLIILPKGDSSQVLVPSSAQPFRAKKTHRGRPQKVYEYLEDETQQEYLIRIARLQKKPLPSFTPHQSPYKPPPKSPSVASEKSTRSPMKRATSEELQTSRNKRLELRDWSEVLGSAALVGFSPDVISRATQRCANLFGEEMTMMTLVEAPYADNESNFATTYMPEEIPDFGVEKDSSDEESDESETKTSSISRKRKISAELDHKSWFCPLENCRRQHRGFEFSSNMRRHLSKAHKLSDDEIDELLDSGKEMDGAVHIDGFLKPVRVQHGVRGNDKGPRSGGRWPGKIGDTDTVEKNGEGGNEESLTSDSDDKASEESGSEAS